MFRISSLGMNGQGVYELTPADLGSLTLEDLERECGIEPRPTDPECNWRSALRRCSSRRQNARPRSAVQQRSIARLRAGVRGHAAIDGVGPPKRAVAFSRLFVRGSCFRLSTDT